MTPSFGTRLRALREAVPDLSARELDRLAKRPPGQAALIESRGQRSVRDDIASAFATALGVRAGYLLTGELPAFAEEPTLDPNNPKHRGAVARRLLACIEDVRAQLAPPALVADPPPAASRPGPSSARKPKSRPDTKPKRRAA